MVALQAFLPQNRDATCAHIPIKYLKSKKVFLFLNAVSLLKCFSFRMLPFTFGK